ncbi:MAG: prepilin-type N-terminal cleavage/methylation domain-containing protein [Psychromonas sp.]|nr:prepilin-type N-terminal cleavage/methylation domain-containing protein [Alteromonadales bacterium]MCP5077090.1 prepilin-type N-terminal cleavage/methylation domain-containing protein [Psychromonas sp.]
MQRKLGIASKSGFSLMEIMIVIAIIGILFSIALPSYDGAVQRGRRSDAVQTLLSLALKQEQYFAQQESYTTTIGNLPGVSSSNDSTQEFYSISVTAGRTGNIATSFKLLATTKGVQSGDTDCATFTIDSTNNKTALKSDSSSNTDKCW